MPIDKNLIAGLSREEKMELIEALWAGLSGSAEEPASPEWHEQALQSTEARLAAGKETVVDWEQAKQDLRKRFD